MSISCVFFCELWCKYLEGVRVKLECVTTSIAQIQYGKLLYTTKQVMQQFPGFCKLQMLMILAAFSGASHWPKAEECEKNVYRF